MTACPTQDQLTKASKASTEIAHDVDLAVDIVETFYTSKTISLAQKDSLIAKLELVAKNGQKFHNALVEFDKKYPEGTEIPTDVIQLLRENWKTVAAPFWELWTELGIFGGTAAVKELREDVNAIEKVLQ
jgi:hypothetical protein